MRASVPGCQCERAAAEQQAGALVLLHPLVPHGLVPCDEAWPGAGAQDAAGHDDVLQQVLGPERALAGLGHVPAAAAAPHRRPNGESERPSWPSPRVFTGLVRHLLSPTGREEDDRMISNQSST